MRILGISAYYHDSAAALVEDGRIVAAAEEERFTRKKHDARFPANAARYCLAERGARLEEVDYIVFYDKPFLKFERLLETYLSYAPRGMRSFQLAMPLWLREKLFQKRLLGMELTRLGGKQPWEERLLFAEHHLSHAASAYYPSPFDSAAVLTMDGVGEWTTTSVAVGEGRTLRIEREIHFPHSLGLLYSAFTYYTGFQVNSGEYKLMGLAPYGEPRWAGVIREHLIDVKEDGSFRLNLDYFDYCTGLRMTNERFDALFGGAPRHAGEELTQRHMDIAASVQAVLEEVILKLTRALARDTGLRNLCMAGGVALNCVANGKVLRDGKFREVWIQPAAGDAGGAVGAALAAYHLFLERPRVGWGARDGMSGAYLGPGFPAAQAAERLRAAGARFERLSEQAVIEATVEALSQGKVVGWFQGRMEFGPRALGGRSILADARLPGMQAKLNEAVKLREPFRPFAPAVPVEVAGEWFEMDRASPYMLVTVPLAAARRTPAVAIPAVTHVDYSARVQTVDREMNPRFHALLTEFGRRTGCPVLVNTSFNVRGEPVVCTPEDAFRCFLGTELDMLVVEDCVLYKEQQEAARRGEAACWFEPD
jgi:carbamoyltransferase